MMTLKKKNKVYLSKIASQMCLFFGLSFGLVLVDALPRYEQGKLTINHPVLAQDNDLKLQQYVNSLRRIEPLRQKTYRNIQQIVGNSQSPSLACHQRENFRQLPDEARNLATNYCEESEKIVKENGLTINEFNQITRELKQNTQMYQKVRRMMNR